MSGKECVGPVKTISNFTIGREQNILFRPVKVDCLSPTLNICSYIKDMTFKIGQWVQVL